MKPYFVKIVRGKLSLCSRDIQVGDIFNFISSDGKLFERKFVEEFNDHEDKINWFKIIGEISPNATWVKEGDEFDKDDLQVRRKYNRWESEHFNNLNLNKSWLSNDCFITIKGPCGHFH